MLALRGHPLVGNNKLNGASFALRLKRQFFERKAKPNHAQLQVLALWVTSVHSGVDRALDISLLLGAPHCRTVGAIKSLRPCRSQQKSVSCILAHGSPVLLSSGNSPFLALAKYRYWLMVRDHSLSVSSFGMDYHCWGLSICSDFCVTTISRWPSFGLFRLLLWNISPSPTAPQMAIVRFSPICGRFMQILKKEPKSG